MKYKIFTTTLLLLFLDLFAISNSRIDSLLQKGGATTQAAKQISKSGSVSMGSSWFFMLLNILFYLLIIVGIIYILVRVLKKFQFKRGFGGSLPPELYKVIGTAPLTHNKQMMLVKFYDTVYLVATSENSVACLDKIDDLEKITNIEAMVPKMDNPADRFSKVLKKKIKEINKGGSL